MMHAYFVPKRSYESIRDMATAIELTHAAYGKAQTPRRAPMLNGLVIFTKAPVSVADMDALGIGVWS